MTYVIASACVDCKDRSCVQACPVDCIYEGRRTLYIQPDECIDCGVCVSFCPPQAIFEDRRLPESERHYLAVNREFFGPAVSGLGAPGGAAEVGPIPCDHPVVAALPPMPSCRS